MSIRALIADDDAAVRSSIGELLARETDIEVVGEARDGRTTVTLALRQKPDIAIVDVTMPGTNGIQATAEIAAIRGGTRVVAISMHDEPEWVRRMVRAGARGYVLKETAAEELVAAVRAVFSGDTYFGRGVELPGIPIDQTGVHESGDPSSSRVQCFQRRQRVVAPKE